MPRTAAGAAALDGVLFVGCFPFLAPYLHEAYVARASVCLVQVGGDSQSGFLDWAGSTLLPALRDRL